MADTYLLYAEALLKIGDAPGAANWVNKVRSRSKAVDITATELSAED